MVTASPSGAQVLGDGANPRIFTGVAAGNIRAGELVVVNAAQTAQAVGSVTSTFTPTDLEILSIKDSNHCNGIAIQTVNSGTNAFIPIATRGTYIFRAAGVVSGGQGMVPVSGAVAQGIQGESPNVSWSGTTIGRIKTNSASGTNLYILGDLNL